MVKEIIKLGAKVNANQDLMFACNRDNFEAAKYFVKEGVNDVAKKQCLRSAKNIEIVKLLLDNGISSENKGLALFGATKEKAELLIDSGADLNVRDKWHGRTPLFYGNKDLLISKGTEIDVMDYCGETPLTVAIKENSNEIVKFLISKGANVNYPTDFNFDKSNCNYSEQGQPPIITAKKSGNKEMVEFLISNGADLPWLNNK